MVTAECLVGVLREGLLQFGGPPCALVVLPTYEYVARQSRLVEAERTTVGDARELFGESGRSTCVAV